MGQLLPAVSQHTEWVDHSLTVMQTVEVGMTRAQLLQVFTTEGGISTRTFQNFVYRDCAFFKVSVEFRPVGPDIRSYKNPDDIITRISEPFLQWSIFD